MDDSFFTVWAYMLFNAMFLSLYFPIFRDALIEQSGLEVVEKVEKGYLIVSLTLLLSLLFYFKVKDNRN